MSETIEKLVEEGYATWGDVDPYEDMVGPFYLKDNGDGTYRSAFISEKRHTNSSGALHGGLLMSFADFALFAIARNEIGEQCVTVGFNSEFISAVGAGNRIEATGEVLRATRSLIFVRGKIFSGEETLMSFSGVLKKVRKRAA